MREELSNLYFDDGGSGTGVWWWEEVWRRTLLLLLLCDASLRNFSYLFASDGEEWNFPSLLCVAQEILCELFYDSFARFKWQSKLWFTISIEDYTKWTIKAWGHNTTTAKLFRSSTRRFRCMRNFCDNLKRKKILFSATFFLSLSLSLVAFATIIYSKHENRFFAAGVSEATGSPRYLGTWQLNILCMKNQLHYHICLKFLPFRKTSHTCLHIYFAEENLYSWKIGRANRKVLL